MSLCVTAEVEVSEHEILDYLQRHPGLLKKAIVAVSNNDPPLLERGGFIFWSCVLAPLTTAERDHLVNELLEAARTFGIEVHA